MRTDHSSILTLEFQYEVAAYGINLRLQLYYFTYILANISL